MIVPKPWDESTEKMSYIVTTLASYAVNPVNSEFKLGKIRFDIACPYDEWVLDEHSLRPYLIMQEIDNLFNGARMAGIGTLQFVRTDSIVLTS